jgi:UDP-N-acetylglucosamine 4,6-dehydratase/5-epimerase
MTAMAGLHVVVTGGTGSFGRAFVRHLLGDDAPPRLVTVVSRDEQKQHEMAMELPPSKMPVRYRLGDVRDAARMLELTEGADVIVHAASIKHVPAAENNPMECVKTNVLGSYNVASAALRNRVPRVIALSTDKAALPSAFYGASKLMLERLFLHADLAGETRFSVVRYANVFGTRGSVVPLFLKLRESGELPITDPRATRFSITLKESIALVLFAFEHGWGGEIVVPIAPSYRITDVARAIAPEARHNIIGLRPGEKPHELLISELEAPQSVRRGDHLIICPVAGRYDLDSYVAGTGAQQIAGQREYSSEDNDRWLGVEEIRALVREMGLQL